jgi:hypothetical protein
VGGDSKQEKGRVLAAAAVTGRALEGGRLRLVTADADTVVEVVGRCVLACRCAICDEQDDAAAAAVARRTRSGMRTAVVQ